MATALDGHADNVSAALLGGVTTSCECEDGRVLSCARRWPDAVQFVIASPAVQLGTPESRSVLPDAVPRQDAVFNMQRALLLWEALGRGDLTLLAEALRDRWHQPFRAPLVPGLPDLLALRHPNLLGVTLSGSGPSVLAWCAGDTAPVAAAVAAVYDRLGVDCQVRVVAVHQPTTGSPLNLGTSS
jgi:homoserine kinase